MDEEFVSTMMIVSRTCVAEASPSWSKSSESSVSSTKSEDITSTFLTETLAYNKSVVTGLRDTHKTDEMALARYFNGRVNNVTTRVLL